MSRVQRHSTYVSLHNVSCGLYLSQGTFNLVHSVQAKFQIITESVYTWWTQELPNFLLVLNAIKTLLQ